MALGEVGLYYTVTLKQALFAKANGSVNSKPLHPPLKRAITVELTTRLKPEFQSEVCSVKYKLQTADCRLKLALKRSG